MLLLARWQFRVLRGNLFWRGLRLLLGWRMGRLGFRLHGLRGRGFRGIGGLVPCRVAIGVFARYDFIGFEQSVLVGIGHRLPNGLVRWVDSIAKRDDVDMLLGVIDVEESVCDLDTLEVRGSPI